MVHTLRRASVVLGVLATLTVALCAKAAPFPRDFYRVDVDGTTFPTLNQAALQFAVEGVITRLAGEQIALPKQRNAELQQWILAYTTQPGATPEDAPNYRLNMVPEDIDALMIANNIRPWPYPRPTLHVLLLWQQAGTLGYVSLNAYQPNAGDALAAIANQYGVPFQLVSIERIPDTLQGDELMWQAAPPPWRAALNNDSVDNATPRNTPIVPPPNALGIMEADMRMLTEWPAPLLIATLSLGRDDNYKGAGVQAMLLMDGEATELPPLTANPTHEPSEPIGADALIDDVGEMMVAAIAKLRARDMRILATTSEQRMVIGGVDNFAKYQQTLRYVAAPQFFIDHSVYEVAGSTLTLNVRTYGEGRAYAEQLKAATPFIFHHAPIQDTLPLSTPSISLPGFLPTSAPPIGLTTEAPPYATTLAPPSTNTQMQGSTPNTTASPWVLRLP